MSSEIFEHLYSEDTGETSTPTVENDGNKVGANLESGREYIESFISEIQKLNFGYSSNQQKSERLVTQFSQDAEGNNSIEGQLMQNEQVQLLLSEVLSDYDNYIGTDVERLQILVNQEMAILEENGIQLAEDNTKIMESMYQYMINNNSKVGFENFIIGNSIASLKKYLTNHLDKNGKLSFISKNEIKARLRIDWFLNLYGEYKKAHAESEENVRKLEGEVKSLKEIFSFTKRSIDGHIKTYLSGKQGKKQLAENLLSTSYNLNVGSYGILFNKNILELFRYTITEYARGLNLSGDKLGYTGDGVYDMQIRSYLYLYGVFSHNYFNNAGLEGIKFDPKKGLDDNELFKILNSILITDGFKQDDGNNNEYLTIEKNIRKSQVIRTGKDNWDRVNRMKSRKSEDGREKGNLSGVQSRETNIQNMSGAEMAKELNLGENAPDFKKKKGESKAAALDLQKTVLRETGKKFIVQNQNILSKYLNVEDIINFFDVGEKGVSFKNDVWERFKTERIKNHPGENLSELSDVKSVLLRFPIEYQNNLKKAKNLLEDNMDNNREIIKNHAIGAVIDSIKEMFQYIVDTNNTGMSGFEFDENNPAKIEDNCLLLFGKFNGEVMNVKYDLITGKLYMNSFIDITSNKITLTGNDSPTSEIGELQPFDGVLYEFYKVPIKSMNNNEIPRRKGFHMPPPKRDNQESSTTSSQPSMPIAPNIREKMERERRSMFKNIFKKMCGTKLDEIGWEIRDKIEKKSTCEPVALNLLKSLDIMPKSGDNTTKNLIGGSDLYKIVQLIMARNNSVEDINEFSSYMTTFMDYIGLNWGKNTEHQDKTRDIARIIFDENNKQEYNNKREYISIVREYTKNFDNECGIARGKAQFDGDSNFGILKIIEKYFTDSAGYPNWKLDFNNIKFFETKLKIDIEEAQDAKNLGNTMQNLEDAYGSST